MVKWHENILEIFKNSKLCKKTEIIMKIKSKLAHTASNSFIKVAKNLVKSVRNLNFFPKNRVGVLFSNQITVARKK